MFHKLILASTAALSLATLPTLAQAQSIGIDFGLQRPTPGIFVPPHQRLYRVEYRVSHWQQRFFVNPFEARQFAYQLRAQGYDVTERNRFGGYEVRFRQNQWTTYRIAYSHAEAHDLEDWLESRGYDARVVH